VERSQEALARLYSDEGLYGKSEAMFREAFMTLEKNPDTIPADLERWRNDYAVLLRKSKRGNELPVSEGTMAILGNEGH
jgi:hypothetical protein